MMKRTNVPVRAWYCTRYVLYSTTCEFALECILLKYDIALIL
jgi:hypothetical protein